MIFYFLLIGVIGIDFLLEYLYNRKQDKITNEKLKKVINFLFTYRILTIIALVFMSTFKSDNVGLDTKAYTGWFESENYGSEIGYSTLQKIVYKLGLSYRWIWFIISLFVSISLVLFVNHFSSNKFMSIFLYIALGVFAQSLNTIRQIIAIAFILLELIFIDKNKWILSIVMVLCATLFHNSAIIGLALIALKFIKLNWITIGVFVGCAVIFPIILPYLSKFISLFGLKDYYKVYIGSELIAETSVIEILYIIALFVIFVSTYIYATKILKLERKTESRLYYFLLIFLMVPLIQTMGVLINLRAVFNRLSMYFFPSLIILVPECLKYLKNNKKYYLTATISCVAVALIFMIYLYTIKQSCGVFPYQFCF